MKTYARVNDGIVVEIISLDDDISVSDAFHPDLASTIFPCDANVEPGWLYAGGKFSANDVPPSQADLKTYAAGKRLSIETGGFTYQGHIVSTDRDSQSKIGNGALAATVVGPTFTTMWKGSDDVFFSLDHDGMIAMATAVMTFVSACFDVEAQICAGITSGAITMVAEIDNTTWPASAG